MRLFIAIQLGEASRGHLVEVQRELTPLIGKASLPVPQNLHLTLKFLGEVEPRRAEALVASLSPMG